MTELPLDQDRDDIWDYYDNLTGHPKIVIPQKFEQKDGFLTPKPLIMVGRVHDETTLLTVAHACQRMIGLSQRPPLDQFLAQQDEILKDEVFPDDSKYYTD